MDWRFWRKTYLPVTNVTMDRNCIVTVEFHDGHRAVFEPYTHGWGYFAEGLQHFRLYNGSIEVVTFNGRLNRYGAEGEHQFVHVVDGYDLKRIIGYWEAARRYLNRLHETDSLGDLSSAWSMVTGRNTDPYYRRLKSGAYPLPTSVG